MAEEAELRQRKAPAESTPEPKPEPETKAKPKKRSKSKKTDDDQDGDSLWIDVLRVISFIIFASCALSYLVTSGKSFVWGGVQPPWYLSADWWKEQIYGPVYMTPEELSAYDGSDPEKPVYLAINGTIYDVSAGRQIYGPGGSYSFFGGTDASRAFVTGCFADDITPDMRGVEVMYLPRDDPETDAHWSAAELEAMKVEELQTAREKAHNALEHWVKFFAKSKKYHKVGYVQREEGWLEKQPVRELCAPAEKGRSKRKITKDKKARQ